MSAALTHVAVGLLLGLALGLRWRHLPLAGLLALLPDLDHLGLFIPIFSHVVETRVTFHNLAFCAVLPVLAALVVWRRTEDEGWRRLALAAPLLLASHLLLDVMPLDVGGAKVALWYPFSRDWVTAESRRAFAADPTASSTLTLLILLLVALSVATVAASRWAASGAAGRRGLARPAAIAGGWILLFPGLALGGYLVAAPAYPVANLALEDPAVTVPQMRFTVVVAHLGGNDAGPGRLALQLWADGQMVAEARNPGLLAAGDRWAASVPLPSSVRDAQALDARVVPAGGGVTYVAQAPRLAKSHVPTELDGALSLAGGSAAARIENVGAAMAPAGSLRALVRDASGAVLADATNADPLPPGGSWTLGIHLPAGTRFPLSLRVVAADDEHAYLNEQLGLPTAT